MRWVLVGIIVGATALSDLLQSWEMKRQGEIRDFRPGRLGRLFARLFRRPYLLLAVACMAISFFAFLTLLSMEELSFAVPATAASYIVETVLAKIVLKEKIHSRRWAGAALVACGVLLLAQS